MITRDQAIVIVVCTVLGIAIILAMLVTGADMTARQECRALGYEWGVQVWWPEPQVECEYRLRVPLRDTVPPIEQGVSDNEMVTDSV